MDPAPFVETERATIKRTIGDIQMALYHAEYFYRTQQEKHHKEKAIEFLRKALAQLEQ